MLDLLFNKSLRRHAFCDEVINYGILVIPSLSSFSSPPASPGNVLLCAIFICRHHWECHTKRALNYNLLKIALSHLMKRKGCIVAGVDVECLQTNGSRRRLSGAACLRRLRLGGTFTSCENLQQQFPLTRYIAESLTEQDSPRIPLDDSSRSQVLMKIIFASKADLKL